MARLPISDDVLTSRVKSGSSEKVRVGMGDEGVGVVSIIEAWNNDRAIVMDTGSLAKDGIG